MFGALAASCGAAPSLLRKTEDCTEQRYLMSQLGRSIITDREFLIQNRLARKTHSNVLNYDFNLYMKSIELEIKGH